MTYNASTGTIVLITVLYALIGIKLKVTLSSDRVGRRFTAALIQRQAATEAERRRHKSRSNVIRMLGTCLTVLVLYIPVYLHQSVANATAFCK